MKKVKVVFLKQTFKALREALMWDGSERAAYMLCHSSTYGDQVKLMPYKVFVPDESDYVKRSAGYYELGKPFINRVFNAAVESQSDFIQCHVHPGDPGIFSGIDNIEEPRSMRHIAEKIEGIYHGSLVFGNSLDTLDGWFFDRGEGKLVPIEKILVIGPNRLELFVPHGSCGHSVDLSPFLDRTVRAFGEAAVKLLGCLDCAIIGVSALGSPDLESVARDSWRSLLMADPDVIEPTNLNRLFMTSEADVGRPKVEFYSEYVSDINPELKIISFQTDSD